MTTDGCNTTGPGTSFDLRPPPAVLSTTPTADSRLRRIEVDLRDFPDAHAINWAFGDGSTMNNKSINEGRVVSHEFVDDGTFVVQAYLFSEADIITKEPPRLLAIGELPIEVIGANRNPLARFIVREVVSDDGIDGALEREFVGTGSSDPDGTIVEYRWDFGDGGVGDGQIVTHVFERSGRYPVRLNVTDNRGGEAVQLQSVLVNSLPVAGFTFEEDANNALRFNFDAATSSDADGGITSFSWDFGDDSDTATGQQVSHTFAVPDNYTVTLTVTDEFGAQVSTSQLVDVTGSDPFVRSADPAFGEVDTSIDDVSIDGENFDDGASVRLVRGQTTVNGTNVRVQSATTLLVDFDLSGAVVGDYEVIVENPDGNSASLADGFRIVTPDLVRLTTSLGDVVVQMVDDAPITTENFLQYVEDGFYDGTIFHRVVPDFVVQGGGFLPGMIMQSGVRESIKNEFSAGRSNVRGTVAMAKLGGDPDSATSQFFFNLADNSSNLDNQNGGFTVFANVIEGLDVVDAISMVPLNGETPVDDVLLISAVRE
ncbi:MAG: peptidylprolyl isomerase [Phycisphaerales bacterium]|nr:peptidylprolyl isomerase [Phycisphaerales bacterium]MCB9857701.1 peptidylprolyl isomerase [Phycisphaerales bacterium]MCB9864790.1 peptidylprolyl isomerase [Phycisphaerales bacterium]